MTDIFDEVREDLRAERAQRLLRRYGGLIVLAAVLVVAGVIGWQAWRANQARQSSAVAATFLDGMRKAAVPTAAAGTGPATTEALAAFDEAAASSSEAYRTLARLRAAALRATSGDLPAALALWDQVSADTAADPLLRDAASLAWIQHQVDAGDPAAIEGRIAPLLNPGNPWRPLAMEQQALLALRTGQDARARDLFKQLAADTAAPTGVRARAGGLLSRMGEAQIPTPELGG